MSSEGSVCEPGAAAVPACLRQAGDAANLCPELLAVPSEEKNQVGWGGKRGACLKKRN